MPSSSPHTHFARNLQRILRELHLDGVRPPGQQRHPVQPRAPDHVAGEALLPRRALLEARVVAVPCDAPGRPVAVDDLREDADAFEALVVAAHDSHGDVDGVEFGDA